MEQLHRAVEAILMAAPIPVESQMLAQILEVEVAKAQSVCEDLSRRYDEEARGFVLSQVAGGWRFQSHPEMASYVEQFVLDGQSARLSAPALETLAIIAYKQPIAKPQLGAIRGVNVDAVVKTLENRGYVEEVGVDPGPGNAGLYGTTDLFLERLGLQSLSDLPPLGDFVPEASVVELLESSLRADVEPA